MKFFVRVKIISFLSLLFIARASLYAQVNGIDVLNYKFNLTLTDSSDVIRGLAIIRFKTTQSANEVGFDLTGLNNAKKGMSVEAVTENGRTVSFVHKENKLILNFGGPLKANEEKEIEVQYSGIPSDGLIISKNKYGHRTFFSDNWPNRAHAWLPCNDAPGDKAAVEFVITVPSHYQVISNGLEIEHTNLDENRTLSHWKEDAPLPTKITVIGVASFAVNLSGFTNGIPVSSWVYPEDREKGFYDYAPAKDILGFFINYIGPYGYKKLANVQSKTVFGGMENASAIFYYENSVTGKGHIEDLLAHEIAHQYFGDMATEKSFSHLWLSEGFATYMTNIYLESKYGSDTLVKRLQKERKEALDFGKRWKQPVVDTVSSYMDLLNANSYQKGGWILHMLRRQFGDSTFRKFIRTYYARYAGKNANTEDLRKVAEEISGRNLEQFFRQWLYTTGNPQLQVVWMYYEKNKSLNITVSQKQENSVYKFPLELEIKSPTGSSRTEKLNITKQSEVFTISVKEKPSRIILDPNTNLLFDGKVEEGKE